MFDAAFQALCSLVGGLIDLFVIVGLFFGDVAIDLNDAAGNQRVAIQVNGDGKVSAKGLSVH